jgi:MFS family permease
VSPTFRSLRIRNYRLYATGGIVSNVGTWMQRIAQDWLVLELTDNNGVALGITTGLQFLPMLLVAPWAGSLADRYSKRMLLIATQSFMGVVAAVLGLLVVTDLVQVWHVFLLAGLLGIGAAVDAPARQSFVIEMVGPDDVSNAVGLNSASFNAARLIGPGVAGLAIAWVGTGWVFVLNGVSFAATIFALTRMRKRELRPMPHAKRHERGQIRAGWDYVRGRSDIVVIMVVVGVVSTFGLNFQLTSALMARTEFGKGASEYGFLGSILAIGSLTGALLAARRERPRVRLVIGAAFGFGVASGVMALMPTYPSFAVACIPVGLASLTMMTAANSTIQMSTDPAMRGRVMAIYMMVFLGATPIGSPIVGWIGETYGARWAIGVGAISALLVASGAALWAIRAWHLEVRYRVLRRPHLQVTYPDVPVPEQPEAEARAEAARKLRAQEARDSSSAA